MKTNNKIIKILIFAVCAGIMFRVNAALAATVTVRSNADDYNDSVSDTTDNCRVNADSNYFYFQKSAVK